MTYPAIFGLFVVLFVFFRCLNCSTPIDHWPRFARAPLRLIVVSLLVAALVGTSICITEAFNDLYPLGKDIARTLR